MVMVIVRLFLERPPGRASTEQHDEVASVQLIALHVLFAARKSLKALTDSPGSSFKGSRRGEGSFRRKTLWVKMRRTHNE
jgi:hypothetical protein